MHKPRDSNETQSSEEHAVIAYKLERNADEECWLGMMVV
jgi:hypothetical protein